MYLPGANGNGTNGNGTKGNGPKGNGPKNLVKPKTIVYFTKEGLPVSKTVSETQNIHGKFTPM